MLPGDGGDRAGPAPLLAGAPCLPKRNGHRSIAESPDSLCAQEPQDRVLPGELHAAGLSQANHPGLWCHVFRHLYQGLPCEGVSLVEADQLMMWEEGCQCPGERGMSWPLSSGGHLAFMASQPPPQDGIDEAAVERPASEPYRSHQDYF